MRTFFTLGTQIGLLVGSVSTPLMIGIDARYSPTLFPKASDQMETGGTFRIGLFLGTYIPIFDFN